MEPAGGYAICPRCGSSGGPVVLGPLFVVTGASGAGKSAIIAPLTRRLRGRCIVFDADMLMDGSDPLSNDQWLAIGHCVAQSGLPTVFLGPCIPDHLEKLPFRRWVGGIHVLLLDCADDVRRDRIDARPPWRARDIEAQVEFGRWLRQNITDRIDTDRTTPEDTAAAIDTWITQKIAN